MPLYIIKGDITKLNCDAIVNAANNTLLGGGGVDGAIHKAAGKELLKECITLGGCLTGEAKITKGYNLSSKYIIHTVGPIWDGGFYNEREKLESCYKNSLILANEYNCQSIAFPVISSGAYKYPFDEALLVGINTIKEFLINIDMIVYIVVYDKFSYSFDKNNYHDLLEFIEENYIDNNELLFESTLLNCSYNCNSSLIEMISNLDDNFSVTLLKLIDLKNMSDVECYKKANVSKQTWYKIMNDKNYKPSKNTILCFAIALELSLEETNHLLQTVGFTLSKSNKFDVIIEYFLINEEYDIYIINETLFKFDQECLGL